MIVRDVVLDLFGLSKDLQYLMLVNLFDEIICFNMYYYIVFFCGGNFDSWMQFMLRVFMIFINFRCRNYDKVILIQLSDFLFYVLDNIDFGEKM